jgi:hypothetical protein
MATEIEKRNMELMQTLDDAWNAQNLEVFRARHIQPLSLALLRLVDENRGCRQRSYPRSRRGKG